MRRRVKGREEKAILLLKRGKALQRDGRENVVKQRVHGNHIGKRFPYVYKIRSIKGQRERMLLNKRHE